MGCFKMLITPIYLILCIFYQSEANTVLTPSPTPAWCEQDGDFYEPGSQFQPDPCSLCTCPESGGQAICTGSTCESPMCVDDVTVEGQCCPSCPNGPNCFAGNEIISAGSDVVVGDSICRCMPYEQYAQCRPNGCYLFGTLYAPGTDFNPSPCESCHCPENGAEPTCWIMDCAAPQCHDYYFEDDVCCPICPTEMLTTEEPPTTTEIWTTTEEIPTTTEIGCTIGGVHFSPGALNPTNGCQRCDIASNLHGFTDIWYDRISGGQIKCTDLCSGIQSNTGNYLNAACTFPTIPLAARNQICPVTDVLIYSTLTCPGVSQALIHRLDAFCSADPVNNALSDPNACP